MNRVLASIAVVALLHAPPTESALVEDPPRRPTSLPATQGAVPEHGNGSACTALLDHLERELSLPRELRAEMRRVIAEHESLIADLKLNMSPSTELQAKLASLREELQAAQDEGDQDRMRLLARKMQDVRREHIVRIAPLKKRLAEAARKLQEHLLDITPPAQREQCARILDDALAESSDLRLHRRDPRRLRSVVDGLADLSAAQRERISAVFQRFETASADSAAPRSARLRRVDQLFDGVLGSLTPAQRRVVEVELRHARSHPTATESTPTSSPSPPVHLKGGG